MAAFLVVSIAWPGTPASASACRTSSPASGAFTVTVCLTAPAAGTVLTGDVQVRASVDVEPTRPVKTLQFALDGGYVLTDYEGPFTFVLPSAAWPNGDHVLKVKATIDRGTSRWTSQPAAVPVAIVNAAPEPPAAPFSPRVPAVASDQPLLVAAVGDGASGRSQGGRVVKEIAAWDPDLFLYLGDVYGKGTTAEFRNWYGASTRYGRFRSITNPVIGNHEYASDPGPAPYFDYWGDPPHRYSYDAGGWHFVHLDTTEEFGQVGLGSPQVGWLTNDLRAAGDCVLVSFHHPPWDRGGHEATGTRLQPLWNLLADEGVDLVLNGHSHNYMRWTPMDGDGVPAAGGTTEVVVGTGGHYLYRFPRSDARVVSSTDRKNGALRLSLLPGSAELSFITTGGWVFDHDTVTCSPKVDHEAPGAPMLTATPDGADAADLSWTAASDDVGVTGYRVERDGTEIAAVGASTLTFHDTGLSPDTAYDYVVVALDAAGHETPSNATSVTTGPAPG
jgi:hypothetical protein